VATYPILLGPLQEYSDSDPASQLAFEDDIRDAEKICDYVNGKMESSYKGGGLAMITYDDIASHTGIEAKRVRKYCLQLSDHNDNSVKVQKQPTQ
jgi:hypothetical protein